MKTLFLIRHAKSSWSDSELKDDERPLDDRGNRDAPIMALRMAENWPAPDKIICSQARRARETAAIMNSSWWNEQTIEIDEGLYHGGASSSLDIIARVPVRGQIPRFGFPQPDRNPPFERPCSTEHPQRPDLRNRGPKAESSKVGRIGTGNLRAS